MSPVGIVRAGQPGGVKVRDALAVVGAGPFSAPADQMVDAAAGKSYDAPDLAVGPAARQKGAQLIEGGLRCGIVASHAFRLTPCCRGRKEHKITIVA